MKNDEFFEDLKKLNFDLSEPASGHEKRFLKKLQQKSKETDRSKLRKLWIPLSSIAAILLISFLIFGNDLLAPVFANEKGLAAVSPQMKETHNFYSNLIKRELKSLEAKRSPNTHKIIKDALGQLETLEKEYQKLQKDLRESGQDKRVIYAMISNFQQRIDLLSRVLEQIEGLHKLKNEKNESNFT